MVRCRWTPLCMLLLASTGWCQTSPASAPATQPDDSQIIRLPHLTVDRQAREARLQTKVVQAQYNLEFLLCKAGGKEYESVLSTPVQAWQLHAALLMLGLQPGIPGQFVGDTYQPPRGPELDIVLRWTDKAGQAQQAKAMDWLALRDPETDSRKPEWWIFTGSMVLPDGTYWADQNGGIIAVANLDSAVIDVPFRSTQTIDDREFVVNTREIPPAGTEVEMVIRPRPGAESADYARAMLEIDSMGQMRINNTPIMMQQLRGWAEAFTRRHSKAQVYIRSDARALSCYAPLARFELKIGGVFDFEYDTAPLTGSLLPRTDAQMKADLNQWARRLGNPQSQIRDPGREALQVIRQIQQQKQQHRRMIELWDQYEKALQAQLDAYQNTREGAPPADHD